MADGLKALSESIQSELDIEQNQQESNNGKKNGKGANKKQQGKKRKLDESNNNNNNENNGNGNAPHSPQNTADQTDPKSKKSKKDGGESKGLKQFSMKVCEKVEMKKETTYDEVAYDLAVEFRNEDPEIDEKNIRRRVYDALNVLMATGIITKDSKKIRWKGVTDGAKIDTHSLEDQKKSKEEEIRKKKEELKELENLEHAYKALISKNEKEPYSTSVQEDRIYLPFIVVMTNNSTQIKCEVDETRTNYFFDFSQPFEIHDECEIFRAMGLLRRRTTTGAAGTTNGTNGNNNNGKQ